LPFKRYEVRGLVSIAFMEHSCPGGGVEDGSLPGCEDQVVPARVRDGIDDLNVRDRHGLTRKRTVDIIASCRLSVASFQNKLILAQRRQGAKKKTHHERTKTRKKTKTF